MKPSDWRALSLCNHHHTHQHSIGEAAFEMAHNIDMKELAEEFARRSPQSKQMWAARKELEERDEE